MQQYLQQRFNHGYMFIINKDTKRYFLMESIYFCLPMPYHPRGDDDKIICRQDLLTR